ncbi:T9SS type A sorting domain-containing protein [bacterium]|nr:MAG: T9SS type A sorting domain-containing protein [bacterium]
MKKVLFIALLLLSSIPSFAQFESIYLFGESRSELKRFPLQVDNQTIAQIWFQPLAFLTKARESTQGVINFVKEEPYAITPADSLDEPKYYPLTFKDHIYGDTIFVNLLTLPNVALDSLEQIKGHIDSVLSVPVYIKNQAFNDKLSLKAITVKIPFPDSLIPENQFVTYPDSADLVLNWDYEKVDSLKFSADYYNAIQSKLSLSITIKAEVKPIIGSSFVFTIPLLDEYGIHITYAEYLGLVGMSSESFNVTIPFSVLGGEDIELFRIPSMDMSAILSTFTSIEDEDVLKPESIQVSAYPNPFNPTTTLSITVQQSSQFSIFVMNSIGQKVHTVKPTSTYAFGAHSFQWDASGLASGIYFVVVQGINLSDAQPIQQVLPISLIK